VHARLCYAALLIFSLSGSAQESVRGHIIAINLESPDPRIQLMMPKLRDRAVDIVEKSARNIQAVLILGSAPTPEAEARESSADYLLTIKLSLAQSVRLGRSPENEPSRTVDVRVGEVPTGIAHSRCVDLLGTLTFAYNVISLSGKNIKFHDSHTMREAEYPLGPEWQCLETLTTRAVESDAAAAVHKLKAKKAL